jgi:hypothetical protein
MAFKANVRAHRFYERLGFRGEPRGDEARSVGRRLAERGEGKSPRANAAADGLAIALKGQYWAELRAQRLLASV